MIIHWLQTFTGLSNAGWYNWWSGFWGGLMTFGIFAVAVKWYQHHKCALCHRIARHPVAGTNYKTCHPHATIPDHRKLHEQHKRRHPMQHKLFNQAVYEH